MSRHQTRSVRLNWQSSGERLHKLKRRFKLLPCASATQGMRFDWIASHLRVYRAHYGLHGHALRHAKRLCRQISKLARKQNSAVHRIMGCPYCTSGGPCDCRCADCQQSRQRYAEWLNRNGATA